MTAVDRRGNPKGMEVGNFRVAPLGVVSVDEFKSVTVDIVGLPDSDGQIVRLPRIMNHWNNLEGQVAVETTVCEAVDEGQREQLIYCLNNLKMPPLVAVWAVFGAGNRDLAKYAGEGLEEKETPVLVGVVGTAGMGKSTVAAMVARKYGGEVVNMALFDELGAEEYIQVLKDKDVEVDDIDDALKILDSLRERDRGRVREMVTLRSRLDRLLALFESGNRPGLIVLDMPGLPKDETQDRTLQIPDMLARYSVMAFRLDESIDYVERLKQAMGVWEGQKDDIIRESEWWDGVFRSAICPLFVR